MQRVYLKATIMTNATTKETKEIVYPTLYIIWSCLKFSCNNTDIREYYIEHVLL